MVAASRSCVIGRGNSAFCSLHEDGGRLGVPDPDGQEAVLRLYLQQHDRLLAGHIEADAVDRDSLKAFHDPSQARSTTKVTPAKAASHPWRPRFHSGPGTAPAASVCRTLP